MEQVMDCYEQNNEPSISLKCEEFLEKVLLCAVSY
jgi:hypothetical protein